MTSIIAIDPGYAVDSGGCACACFAHGVLREVWFERPEDIRCRGVPVLGAVVWERPVYRARDAQYSHVPPETLIELAIVGSGLAHAYASGRCPVVAMRPHEWKHSRHKPPHHKALWRILGDCEREVLGGAATYAAIEAACTKGALTRWKPGVAPYPKSFVTHNLLDAVALGCTYLRRMIP